MEELVRGVMKDRDRPAYKFATDIPGMPKRELPKVVRAVRRSLGLLASQPRLAQPQRRPASVPHLNDRACGWLRHLYEKATTVDDWSYRGEGPHEWWDKTTGPPMTSWPRFDLQESAYAIALMADKTPAWREVYEKILEGICSRYVEHWGAVDFLNQFDDDPNQAQYPSFFKLLLPPDRFRTYNAPGWTGNGLNKFPDGAPAGYEKDPIAAEGMLFYKGWLILTLGIYTRVSGNKKYLQPFDVAGVGGTTTRWTLGEAAEHLKTQWSQRECGLH